MANTRHWLNLCCIILTDPSTKVTSDLGPIIAQPACHCSTVLKAALAVAANGWLLWLSCHSPIRKYPNTNFIWKPSD